MALMLSVATGCKDEEVLDNEGTSKEPVSEITNSNNLNLKAIYSQNHKIPASEAIEIAMKAADEFTSDGTRSGNPRTIENYAVYGSRKKGLRSYDADSDSLYYVFNFADDEGFAIVSADDRIPSQVLAFVDKGSLEDDTDNPGVKVFLENMASYVDNSITDFEERKDSLKLVAETKYATAANASSMTRAAIDQSMTTTLLSEEAVSPLLKTVWGQGAPYNSFTPNYGCKTTSNGRTYTGCVATATAQVMAYWGYPKNIGSYIFYWDKMTSSLAANDENYVNIAQLMFMTGLGVGMEYGCSGSSAKTQDAYNWLVSIGYIKGYSGDFNKDIVIDQISKDAPVIIRGGGHCWVIDGYKKYTYKVTYTAVNNTTGQSVTVQNTVTQNYLHYNWGWDGLGNGYFAAGVFDEQKPYSRDWASAYMNKDFGDNVKIFCVNGSFNMLKPYIVEKK